MSAVTEMKKNLVRAFLDMYGYQILDWASDADLLRDFEKIAIKYRTGRYMTPEEKALRAKGHNIQAIMHIKERIGCSLSDAKCLFDES